MLSSWTSFSTTFKVLDDFVNNDIITNIYTRKKNTPVAVDEKRSDERGIKIEEFHSADEENAYEDTQDETGRNENNNRNAAKNQPTTKPDRGYPRITQNQKTEKVGA